MKKLMILLASLALVASAASANEMLKSVGVMSECHQQVENSNVLAVGVKKNSQGGADLRVRKNKQAKKDKVPNGVFQKAKAEYTACFNAKMGEG